MKSTTLPVALLLLDITTPSLFAAQEVQNTAELIGAVEQAKAGDVIQLATGTYTLSAPLVLPSGVTLQGAGTSETTITPRTGSPQRTLCRRAKCVPMKRMRQRTSSD